MKKFLTRCFCIIALILSICLTGCDININKDNANNNGNSGSGDSEIVDDNDVKVVDVDEKAHNFKLTSSLNNAYHFDCQDDGCSESMEFTATCSSGTSCITVTDSTITFGTITEDTVYSLTGTFYGNILINVGDNKTFELELNGFTMTSESDVPIYIESSDDVTITAKKDTLNYVNDTRSEVDEDGTSASIYSTVDLDVQGKGSLYVTSTNNNGIHTKDNLDVQNLTLQVDCKDNALKGNDGVEIESGNITLISRKGNGIKTTNSHLSSKGKQKGDVKLEGGNILIYSACDAIDAAHDVIIDESECEVNLQLFTDKYSKYSEEVTATSSDVIYIKFSSTSYKFSIEYSNDSTSVWYNSSTYKSSSSSGGMGGPGMGGGGMGNSYYFPITKPSGYTKMQVYIYTSSQTQGQSDNYYAATDVLTVNSNYDTISFESYGGGLSYRWTNYSTNSVNPGGGGMQEGNQDKGDYSTKGIKADNEIAISGGNITISSYDDAIHTNNTVQLGEEGAYYYGTGDIEISGGILIIHSNDDGIHADGSLAISGGTINVTNSYEGLEGTTISISNGYVYVTSSDDGMNSTATSGNGITISGGVIYVYAGGDGLDANTKSSGAGLTFNGGKTIVISTGSSDSSLDTENGYTYSSGYVVAIGKSGGMNNGESVNCSNFSKVGSSKSLTISTNNFIVVKDIATIKSPTSMSALVVVLGKTSASISSSSSSDATVDSYGIYWAV